MRTWLNIAAAGLLAVANLSGHGAANAAEITVLNGMGSDSGMRELAAGFEKAKGHKVVVSFETAPTLAQKLASNAPSDLIVAAPEDIEDLIKKGKVVTGTHVPFALAGLGLSVKAGAPKPDIGTVEAFKRAMLAAKSVGYSRGHSGMYTEEAMERLGIAEQMKPKTTRTGGGPVAEYLAKGDFEIGIQQINVLVGVAGTDYVGPLPGDLNKPVPFSVGLVAVSKQQDVAREMIKFMTSAEAGPLLRKGFMDPVAH
jgi:molybdate transport system substrate-binding protein